MYRLFYYRIKLCLVVIASFISFFINKTAEGVLIGVVAIINIMLSKNNASKGSIKYANTLFMVSDTIAFVVMLAMLYTSVIANKYYSIEPIYIITFFVIAISLEHTQVVRKLVNMNSDSNRIKKFLKYSYISNLIVVIPIFTAIFMMLDFISPIQLLIMKLFFDTLPMSLIYWKIKTNDKSYSINIEFNSKDLLYLLLTGIVTTFLSLSAYSLGLLDSLSSAMANVFVTLSLIKLLNIIKAKRNDSFSLSP